MLPLSTLIDICKQDKEEDKSISIELFKIVPYLTPENNVFLEKQCILESFLLSTFKQLLEVFKQQEQHELSVNCC